MLGTRLIDLDERLMSLERDQARLLVSLQDNGIEVPVVGSDEYGLERNDTVVMKATKGSIGRAGSLRWRDHGGRSDDEQEIVSVVVVPCESKLVDEM